jgi:cytochrome d ubiquinol oxidase subunit I
MIPVQLVDFRVAAAFGLASALSVIVLGDESGHTAGEAQKTRMAAIEAMQEPEPEPAPAGLKLVAGTNEARGRNDWEVEEPWLMGLLGTRSISRQNPGIHEIKALNRERIANGVIAVTALEVLRKQRDDAATRQLFERYQADLGSGRLLRKYVADVRQATPEMITRAVDDTVPRMAPVFWGFRLMACCRRPGSPASWAG